MATIGSLLRAALLASFAAWIAPAVFAQAPVITAALNQLGKTTISPGDSVILYGSLPADAARNQSVTVGGKPGTVNVVLINRNVTESITILLCRSRRRLWVRPPLS